jgi:hypothetical protein
MDIFMPLSPSKESCSYLGSYLMPPSTSKKPSMSSILEADLKLRVSLPPKAGLGLHSAGEGQHVTISRAGG